MSPPLIWSHGFVRTTRTRNEAAEEPRNTGVSSPTGLPFNPFAIEHDSSGNAVPYVHVVYPSQLYDLTAYRLSSSLFDAASVQTTPDRVSNGDPSASVAEDVSDGSETQESDQDDDM